MLYSVAHVGQESFRLENNQQEKPLKAQSKAKSIKLLN